MKTNTTSQHPWRIPTFFGKLAAGTSLLFVSATAFALNPTPPGDLRVEVYSKTAAEIFWDRATDDGWVMGYEIAVNSEIVDTPDALSHFFDDLEAGVSYEVVVTSLDDEGDRSTPATISFVTGEASPPTDPGTGSEPADGPPAAPNGLVASVYSSGSGELFWDRPDAFGLVYEVTRDGTVLATTDGTSYYERDLEQGTEYQYEVVAIDPLGQRSTPGMVLLETAASSGGTGGGDTGETPPTAAPASMPTGLTANIYSSRSIELTWDRPEGFGLTYEVMRDGSVLGTTNGISFQDTGLTAGIVYFYEVVAIDQAGERSDTAFVLVNTQRSQDNIREPGDLYTGDGYGPVNVIRVDLRTATGPGPCNADDESGCTLDDVLADIDKYDDHTVDIEVHFQSDDFPDDGAVSNASLRLRGGGSRFAPQKSFRIKLDSKEVLWRGERHLQLNKHPFDASRIRNKLAMDVMSEIPNLPSLRTQFVNLWIDDGDGPVDYGLFTHVERVNKYFLRKRGWNEDDNLYKAEYFRFAKTDLDNLQIDENGEPVDEDSFERTLEIENGDDHRMLVQMMTALHDPARTYESVLEQYFDRDNVMAWVATNILLHQADAVRHNFILYNPLGTEKFYFVPWDYDEAMGVWKEPPNDLSNDSLRQRTEYGYAVAARNTFLENFYKMPGIHEEILATVDSLRQNIVTDEAMAMKADHYIDLVAPFQSREPDSVNNPGFTTYSAVNRTNAPGENAEALRSRFGVLMPPTLALPSLDAGEWTFSWQPAHDVTGEAGTVSYQLQIATSPTFEADTVMVDIGAIDDAIGTVEQTVDAAQLPTGEYFARLIATPANQPERFWQVSGNKLYLDNQTYYGVLHFEAP